MKLYKWNQLKRYCSNQTGASFIFILLSTFLLITLATIIVHFSNTDIQSARKQTGKINAYYIAEAGLEEAIYQVKQALEQNKDIPSNILPTDFHGGVYEVTIQQKENSYHEKIGYTITSVGSYEGEEKTLTSWVREPLWNPEDEPTPEPLKYAIYANRNLDIRTFSGVNINLLNLIPINIDLHKIDIEGDNLAAHANNNLTIKHMMPLDYIFSKIDLGILNPVIKLLGVTLHTVEDILLSSTPPPTIEGEVTYGVCDSSINSEACPDQGRTVDIDIGSGQLKEVDVIPMPQFDFDYARQKAIEVGGYVPAKEDGSPIDIVDIEISLLGLDQDDNYIFIEGNLYSLDVELLQIIPDGGRTIVVNGDVNLLNVPVLPLGNARSPLNIIAKGDINIGTVDTAITGTKMNGILFSQSNLTTAGHLEVNGFVGAKNIELGGGLVSGLLGLLTGNMVFTYDDEVFSSLPYGIGFKQNTIELMELKESANNES